jgi:hypothetical protein
LLYLEDHPELKKRSDSYKDTEYERAMQEDLGGPPQAETQAGYSPPVTDWVDEPID